MPVCKNYLFLFLRRRRSQLHKHCNSSSLTTSGNIRLDPFRATWNWPVCAGSGYYSGGATKLGKDGDFTTAPEMSALFGATLATLAGKLFAQTTAQVMEFGAGTGKLARDFLTECQLSGIAIERYFIVELSGELRARQEDLLKDFPQVVWLQEMPASFSGIVLGNEVLDAMPVDLVRKTADGWCEIGVALADDNDAAPLQYRERACDAAKCAQIPDADELPVGYLTEVHAVASGFMHSLAQMLNAGCAASWQRRRGDSDRLRFSGARVLPSAALAGQPDVPLSPSRTS
jgi:SAM-dependent MidA family methyltransferase